MKYSRNNFQSAKIGFYTVDYPILVVENSFPP